MVSDLKLEEEERYIQKQRENKINWMCIERNELVNLISLYKRWVYTYDAGSFWCKEQSVQK